MKTVRVLVLWFDNGIYQGCFDLEVIENQLDLYRECHGHRVRQITWTIFDGPATIMRLFFHDGRLVFTPQRGPFSGNYALIMNCGVYR